MSYENTIRAKHQFEDAFKEALRLLSILTGRELEVAAAKIGDGLKAHDSRIDHRSSILTTKLIQMVLDLRSRGELSQSKVLRIWMRRKKNTFALRVAEAALALEYIDYKKERAKVEKIRKLELNDHRKRIEKWQKEVKQLSLLELIFAKPPHPGPADLTSLPSPPPSRSNKAHSISTAQEFSEIVIDVVYFYRYPNIEYSEDYADESNVRSTAIRLLESEK